MARGKHNNRSNKVRVGKVTVPVPQPTPMAPGQEQRLARFLHRGMRDRNGTLAVNNSMFRTLGKLSWVRLIVDDFITRAMPFCREPRWRGDTGIDVRLKTEAPMTPAREERRRQILDILLSGGVIRNRPADQCPGAWAGDNRTAADPLPVAVRKLLQDSLVMDSAGIRIEQGGNPKQFPVAWWKPEDGARIRKADSLQFSDNYRPDVKYPEWVVLDRDEGYKWVLAWNEFAAFIRNPDTSEEGQGLGVPELASAFEVLTALVTAFKYNTGMFTEWKLPAGFFEIAGGSDEEVLDEFIEDLEMLVGGGQGFYNAVPYITTPEGFEGKEFIKWHDVLQRPTDMQFKDLILLAFNQLCGLWHVSPERMGFPSFDNGKAKLNDGGPDAQIQNGNDAGFVPVMEQLRGFLSTGIVEKFDDGEWHAVVVGLDKADEKTANEQRRVRLDMGLTSIGQEQNEADLPTRRKPLDTILWAKTEGELLRAQPKLADDGDRLYKFTARLYIAQGGNFSTVGQFGTSAATQQEYVQEIMRAQQAKDAESENEHVDPWAAFGQEHPDRIAEREAGGEPEDDETAQPPDGRQAPDEEGQEETETEELGKSVARPRLIEIRVR